MPPHEPTDLAPRGGSRLRRMRRVLGEVVGIRRRRQRWRYVSAHRHGAGLALVALLLVCVHLHWAMTNEGRVRRLAQEYLEGVTGGQVYIDSGRFSFFHGIELKKVSIFPPGSGQAGTGPMLYAEKVTLDHRPAALLFEARLDVTRVACSDAVVTITRDRTTGRLSVQDMIAELRQREASAEAPTDQAFPPPEFAVRNAELRLVDIWGGQKPKQTSTVLNVSGYPTPDDHYMVRVEKRQPSPDGNSQEPMHGWILVDMRTGDLSGSMELQTAHMNDSLYESFESWRKRHDVRGAVQVRWSYAAERGQVRLDANLAGVSLTLPPEEGGLRLRDVDGNATFTDDGVELGAVRGAIAEGPGRRFMLTGTVRGYEPNSPLDLTLLIEDANVPVSLSAGGAEVQDMLDFVHRTYQPQGLWDFHFHLHRERAGEEVTLAGTATAKGVSMTAAQFPYPLHGITGNIRFSDNQVVLDNLHGTNGSASVRIDGNIVSPDANSTYRIVVEAHDIPLDQRLRHALPRKAKPYWDAMQPNGVGSAVATILKLDPNGDDLVHVDVTLDGHAGLQYRNFPYPVTDLVGRLEITNDSIGIDVKTEPRPGVRCEVVGAVAIVAQGEEVVDLRVRADLPIDDRLRQALRTTGERVFAALDPCGMLQGLDANVRSRPGEPLDYRVHARVVGGTLRPREFPYRITDVAGDLDIRPDLVTVRNMTGRHGDANFVAFGTAPLGEDDFGLDLDVRADHVAFDDDLHAALPEGAVQAWELLKPVGSADLRVRLTKDLLEPNRPADANLPVLAVKSHQPADPNRPALAVEPNLPVEIRYDLAIQPRQVSIQCPNLPLRLDWRSGTITAVPGRVSFHDVRAGGARTRLWLDGNLAVPDGNLAGADLRLDLAGLTLDKPMLDAMGELGFPLTDRVQPGGAGGIQVYDLRLRRLPDGGSAASLPSGQPVPRWQWDVDANLALAGVGVDLGFGLQTLTGTLAGAASQDANGMRLDANLALNELLLEKRTIQSIRGRMIKQRDSRLLKFADVAGECYGGRIAGRGEVRLAEAPEYGFRLSFEGVNANRLFYGGSAAGGSPGAVAGKLAGTVEVIVRPGGSPARQAAGALHVRDANLVRIPIVLSMVNVLYLSLPRDWAFDEAYLTYHLRDSSLVFDEIYLVGAASSALGTGRMNVDSQAIDLTFLAGPPGKLPRISGLAEEIIGGLLRELVEWRVTGKLPNPQFRTVPLRAIETLLDRLLNPGKTASP